MAEFELIARIAAQAGTRSDVLLGIGDDAALLQPAPGMQLVVASDTLNAGVHFAQDAAPFDIGWKALAVNLSDLAAMGAAPAWFTLGLSLPRPDAVFVEALLQGMSSLARGHGVALVGGDTTRGPLSLCVTAIGQLAPGAALRRAGAREGDTVWVSGSLGDAAAALAQWQAGDAGDPVMGARLRRPTPRVALGQALASIAHACIDVSDGLLADLGHVCTASGVGAVLEVDALPASPALQALALEPDARRALQAAGGDDYELCFTAPEAAGARVHAAAQACGVAVTAIGRIVAGDGVLAVTGDGHAWTPPRAGYVHFA